MAELFNLSDDSLVWRVLCLLAVILSVAAALSTNFATSHSLADRVSAAETCSAQLEGLQVALTFGHIEIEEAVKLYQQYTTQVAFVEALLKRADGRPPSKSATILKARGGSPRRLLL
ncbi:hypothetical protein ACOM2C_17280 [Pseudarthrobacter sp. So.54]